MLAESSSTIVDVATGPTRVFLVADDLTGALDSAAPFAAPERPVEVRWSGDAAPRPGSVAFDCGTRELGPEAAEAKVAALIRAGTCEQGLCFAKLDSLLRGNAAAEIAAWIRCARPARCLIAPAFPYHHRVTRGGRQFFLDAGAWTPTATDLAAPLRARGLAVTLCRPGDAAPDGLSLWDAETDADLARVVAAGRAAAGSTLWSGSGGLAAALAAGRPRTAAEAWGNGPVLGLFGSDHPVTAGQLDACGEAVFAIGADVEAAATAVRARLVRDGIALVRPTVATGLDRRAAAAAIERQFGALLSRLDPPGTLLVAGGETLRGLCRALDADHLRLAGEVVPGVAASTMAGGRFDGVRVISKSGAFGDRDLLRRLVGGRLPPSLQGPAS